MRKRNWTSRNSDEIVAFALMFGLAFLFAGPFLWSVLSSFKGENEILRVPPTLFPKVWHPENYVQVFTEAPFAQYILNTVKLVFLNVVGGVLSAALVAYGFARFRWPGRDFFFMLAMSTMMLPREVTTIPTYILFSKIKWIDTLYPLFVPSWFGGGAFLIFLFRQYIMSLPRELDEAAYMDGAGPFRIFRSVLLPLSRPIMATAVVITFIGVWSDFWGPFIFLSSRENFTISLGLRVFASEAVRMTGMGKVTQHLMMAAMVISMLPCLVLFLFAQQYFVKSMVTAGFKGI
jgi:multiple sugar transport system permease protein